MVIVIYVGKKLDAGPTSRSKQTISPNRPRTSPTKVAEGILPSTTQTPQEKLPRRFRTEK